MSSHYAEPLKFTVCQLYLNKPEGEKKAIPGKEKVSFINGFFFSSKTGQWQEEREKQASQSLTTPSIPSVLQESVALAMPKRVGSEHAQTPRIRSPE